MANYDPKILQKYADKLYRDAAFVVFVVTILFAVVGLAFGLSVGGIIVEGRVSPDNRTAGFWFVGLAGVLTFAFVGYLVGQALAFWYRLKAQQILCQKQIEFNTRVAATKRQTTSFDEIVP